MKTKALFALFAFVAISHFSGLNVASAETPVFKAGVILPLTGPVAEFGVATRNGIELAKREHPALFTGMKFLVDDSQYDGKKALAGFQKMKADSNPSLFYVWGYGPGQAVVPVAEQQGTPLLVVSAERAVAVNKKFILRFGYTIDMIADKLLQHLRSIGVQRLSILKVEIAYMAGLIDSLKARFKEGEGIDLLESFQPSDSDFKSTITKLRSKPSGALGIFLLGGQITQFYRQAAQMNFKPVTIGTDFFDSMSLVSDAAGTMEGAVFAAPFVDAEFTARYEKAFGNDIQAAWAANGYEFAILVAKLFGKSGPQNPDDVMKALRSSSAEQGSSTKFAYNADPDGPGFDFKVVNRKVEQGRIADLDK